MADVVNIASVRDAAILSLFQRWLAQTRALDGVGEWHDEAYAAVLRRRNETEKRIFALSGGPVGLAVKVFLRCHEERQFGAPYDPPEWFDSVLRDAAALAPDIALARSAL